MSVTEKLFTPLLRQPSTPLITYYDDATGGRIELSRATAANWAAKTANWLRDECDIEPGAEIGVALPAHWQTVGVLLVADRAKARGVTDGARVLSTRDWTIPDGVIDGLLTVLSVGGSLVQCANTDPARLADRAATERTTITIG